MSFAGLVKRTAQEFLRADAYGRYDKAPGESMDRPPPLIVVN